MLGPMCGYKTHSSVLGKHAAQYAIAIAPYEIHLTALKNKTVL
ncbi:MAG: hypothetical protein WAW41_05235 [Methylobacter sp.]